MNKRIAMLAYAEYYTDARIKGYVNILSKNNYYIDVFCLYDKYTKSESENIRFHFISKKYQGKSKLLYLLFYAIFFVKAFFIVSLFQFKKRYSAWHVHNMPDLIVFCTIIAKFSGAKIILDMHDIMIAAILSKFDSTEKSLLYKIIKFQTVLSVKYSDIVIFADHSQLDFVLSHKILIKKSQVLLNLPPQNLFFSRKEIPSNSVLKIIYHGTITRRLGLDLAIKSIEILKENVSVSLTIVGDGDFKEELIEYCRKTNLLDNFVFFKPFMEVERLQEEIEKYDLGIISNRRSLLSEKCMLPVKMLEYIYIGLPVVAPRLEVIQRYFSEDSLIYYKTENIGDMSKRIIEFYSDRKILNNNYIKKAREFYNIYNWDNQEREYLGLIDN